jgi:hypothetical protein
MKRQSQQGIALVITLILLTVITFMTVTFLVVSRHEGEQVDTTTQQNVSRWAAEGMAQMAEAQIIANLMGPNNGLTNLGLIVSADYVSQFYDNSGTPAQKAAVTNVNYTDINGNPLSTADLQQMLNNLQYLPRAPVFISTNKTQLNPEFRYYVDENGNGRFETNGLVMNQDVNGQAILDASGKPTFSVQVGDPEWVGFLEHPDQRHSASNFFLSRGAFIAIPISEALDVNYIHNQARLSAPIMKANAPEAYYRNQGVSTAEINLAAFLAMVNINVWGPQTNAGGGFYAYATDPNGTSTGTAFGDAAAIMQYRNSGNYNSLSSFQGLFGPPGVTPAVNSYLVNGAVDAYAVGPLMTGVNPPFVPAMQMVAYSANPWSGANNPVQLTRPRDLLTMIPNPGGPSANSFTNRLYSIGTALDTYDRYTFYRLLGQMGFSSAPEPAPYPMGGSSTPGISQVLPLPIPTNGIAVGGRNQMSYGTVPEAYPYLHGRKMNLNYNNLGRNGLALTATNFMPWAPVEFFTNAADRLLRTYYPTNFAIMLNGSPVVTNININFIPIYPVNFYTPGVHRLLQLAANMYDATTNKNAGVAPNNFDYPSVFRPYFARIGSGTNAVIYISGYQEQQPVFNSGDSFWNSPLDLRRQSDLSTFMGHSNPNTVDNIYGVPYVIGARTNLPNFNQFSMAPVVQVTRAMLESRSNGVLQTNISYQIGISNVMSVQCWNSYAGIFNRQVTVIVSNDFSGVLTNNFGGLPGAFAPLLTQPLSTTSTIPVWPVGYINTLLITNSFQYQLNNGMVILPNDYVQVSPPLYGTNSVLWNLLTPKVFVPDWVLIMTNRVRVIIQDFQSKRILDCVQLGGLGQLPGLDSQDDIVSNLAAASFPNASNNIWNMTPISPNNALPIGFFTQLQISLGSVQVAPKYWASPQGIPSQSTISQEISGFSNWVAHPTDPNLPLSKQVPYAPTTKYAKLYTWSANDPLVHYTVGDLTDLSQNSSPTNGIEQLSISDSNTTWATILYPRGGISPRYRPWTNDSGLNANMQSIPGNELEFKDPMIRQSSDWQFPTNKYPNVAWVGRVHRGTPWQTVYLKSHGPGYNSTNFPGTWQYWTGNQDPVDAQVTQPISDWALLDLFTTSPNDNASRGQLSVNQTNVAAWAAVLGDVMVISNTPKGFATNISITQSNVVGTVLTNTVQYLVSSINAQRASVGGGVFSSVGQLFSTPALTVASPFINTRGNPNLDTNLTDAVYERIPQQIGSLLRVGTPRYEIYAYGQALKPADKSIVQSGQFFGMCTNYQITGEVLTRTVVRFDNPPILPQYPRPGTQITYALPILGQSTYAVVTNTVPPVRAVVESFQILGPDQ